MTRKLTERIETTQTDAIAGRLAIVSTRDSSLIDRGLVELPSLARSVIRAYPTLISTLFLLGIR